MTRRFWSAWRWLRAADRGEWKCCGMPVRICCAGRMAGLDRNDSGYAGGALGGMAVLSAGWTSDRQPSTNMFTLIAMGTGWLSYSWVATAFPQIFPGVVSGMGVRPDVYFEAGRNHNAGFARPSARLRARSRTSAAIRAC